MKVHRGDESHCIVPSSMGSRVLLGAFERAVIIQDLATGDRSAPFDTTFDFGGERLALSDEINGIVAGAYYAHGLAFYCGNTGKELWRRKDIKKVQHVTLSRDGKTAYCGREGSALAAIDLITGESIRSIRGVRSLHESKYDSVKFLDGSSPQVLSDSGKRRFKVESSTYIDVAFSPGLVFLSECAGALRCMDISTGKERWHYRPESGSHVLKVSFCSADQTLLGVEWPYEIGGDSRLIRWSLESGTILDSTQIATAREFCFGLDGHVLASTTGRIMATTKKWTFPVSV